MMRNLLPALFFLLTLSANAQMLPERGTKPPFRSDTLHLSTAENDLAKMINKYRKEKHLDPIQLSSSLSLVARFHAYDLYENYRYGGRCNLHSWSKSQFWSSCCYTPDHRSAACMWDKPRELTNYTGDGYEIAYYSSDENVPDALFIKEALDGWKKSRGHNEIIVNQGKWKTAAWKAMGLGIYRGYAIVWFGEEADAAGPPLLCNE